jgi:hypothetical protein
MPVCRTTASPGEAGGAQYPILGDNEIVRKGRIVEKTGNIGIAYTYNELPNGMICV